MQHFKNLETVPEDEEEKDIKFNSDTTSNKENKKSMWQTIKKPQVQIPTCCVSTTPYCFFLAFMYSVVLISAGPNLLDLLDPRTYFFNCLGSGARQSHWIFATRILATDLPDLFLQI